MPPEEVPELVAALRDEDLDVAGLMAVGPPGPPEAARPGFALVSTLADTLDLPVRSMGMTDDLEVALSEGSTMVRLGRALFGDRPPAARLSRGTRARPPRSFGPPGARARTHGRGGGRPPRSEATHYAVTRRKRWQLRS